jgi:hypothetical protein
MTGAARMLVRAPLMSLVAPICYRCVIMAQKTPQSGDGVECSTTLQVQGRSPVALTPEELEAVDGAPCLPLTVRRARSGGNLGIVAGKRPPVPIPDIELGRIVSQDAVRVWDLGDGVQTVSAMAKRRALAAHPAGLGLGSSNVSRPWPIPYVSKWRSGAEGVR